MHLDPYQDGCYRRLIDHYMKTRAPLPDNDLALARIVGASYPDWIEKASDTVRPFFQEKNGKLYHKRCDKELAGQDKRSKRLSESGKNGANKRWSKSLEANDKNSPPISPPNGQVMAQDRTGQDNTLQEDSNTDKHTGGAGGKTKKLALPVTLPDWIPPELWESYLDHRKKIRKPMTANAQNLAIADLRRFREKGHDPIPIISTTIVSGWTAFYEPKTNPNRLADKPNKADRLEAAKQKALKLMNEEDENAARKSLPQLPAGRPDPAKF